MLTASTRPDASAEALDHVWAVLGDPLRRRVVAQLAAGEACTCHLVDALGAKQPTVSHHLRVLREAGLVDATPRGRFTWYALRPEALDALSAALADLAAAARAGGMRRECP